MQDMQEWTAMSEQTGWLKRDWGRSEKMSQRQASTWDYHSSTCSSSLCSCG